MRPSTLAVTLTTTALLAVPGAASTSKTKSPSSSSSSASNNGYDAVICGENGYADGSGLSYSANAWNPDDDGFQCLSIINASSSTSSGFDATWKWPVDAQTVHSYPHVTFSSGHLPAPLHNLSALRLAAEWAYSPGSISTAADPSRRVGLDASGLNDVGAIANIAFDMFLDPNPAKSTDAQEANYEMMIWIGKIGQPQPLGFDSENATCYTQQLGSFNFTLYSGQNSRGTSVFTWVSPTDQTKFDEDITPLLQYLWRNDLVSADARLGLIEFGSEAYHSGNNVTFSAGDFSLDVWLGSPVRYELNLPALHCKRPEGPDGPQSTPAPKQGLGVGSIGQPGVGLMAAAFLASVLTGLG